MDLKLRVFLLLTVLGISAYAVQGNKLCDWGRGTCTYYKDPCPPNWERCPQYDTDCPVATNHCCCRKKPVPPPSAGKCDWGRGTCTYVNDPCPPNWERCPQFDEDCPVETNHCCCRKQLKSVPLLPLLRPVKKDDHRCDHPVGVCTYINDNCPPGMKPCGNYYCPLPTNRCCCR